MRDLCASGVFKPCSSEVGFHDAIVVIEESQGPSDRVESGRILGPFDLTITVSSIVV